MALCLMATAQVCLAVALRSVQAALMQSLPVCCSRSRKHVLTVALTTGRSSCAVTAPSGGATAADFFGLGPSEQSQQTCQAVPATGNGPGPALPAASKQKAGKGAHACLSRRS